MLRIVRLRRRIKKCSQARMNKTMRSTTNPIATLMNCPRSCPTSSIQLVSRSLQISTVCFAGTGSISTSIVRFERVELMFALRASIGVEMSEFIEERNSSRVGIDELRSVKASIMVDGRVTFSSAESSGMSIVGISTSTL